MSKVFIEESTLSSIGNAIRQKTGKSKKQIHEEVKNEAMELLKL